MSLSSFARVCRFTCSRDSTRRPLSTRQLPSIFILQLNSIKLPAVGTLVKVRKALKESGGAATEYQDAVEFLTGVGKTLTGIH